MPGFWHFRPGRTRLFPDDVADDAEAMRMSIQQQDVAEARRAVLALTAAVERLSSSQTDTVDLRRLTEDVRRVGVDLDLVAGPPSPDAILEPAGERDLGYDPREFGDGTYEGTTPRRR